MTSDSAPRHCPACLLAVPPEADVCPRCASPLAGALGPGSLIAGRYRFVRELGSGGMGVVFEVHDLSLDEAVALKLLRTDLLGAAAARLRSEIKLARRVGHRNVCRIFEYGEDGPARFIVMEKVEGETLRQRVKRGPLRPEDAARMVAQAAEGLAAIHEAGIVHRDVKTPNLMVTASDVVKVMDFGIAKSMGASDGVTQTGMLVGTPEYMSPEQAAGRPLDGRSDLYSLGIVLYELLAADVPFRGDTPVATLWKHLHEAPSFDTPAARRIPAPLRPLVGRLLAKAREDRPATAAEVAAELWAAAERLDEEREASLAVTASTRTSDVPQSLPAAPPSGSLVFTPSSVTPAPRPSTPPGRDATARRASNTLAWWAAGGFALMFGMYYVGHTTGRRHIATGAPEATVAPAAPASLQPPPASVFVPAAEPTALPSTLAPTPRPAPGLPTPSPSSLAPAPRPSPIAPPPTLPAATFVPPTVAPTIPPTLVPGEFVEDRPPDVDALAAALGLVERARFEDARRALDAVLARKDPLQLPVARAKRGGVERCTLTIQPAKRVLRQGGGMSLYANSVKLVDHEGRSKASAMMRALAIEGSGRAPAGPGERDPSPAAYLRLRFGDDEHTIFFWPSATCRQAKRADSNDGMLQCDARGLAQQEFVAGYVADTIRAIVRAMER